MSLVVQTLSNPETQRNLIALGLGILGSAPVAALSVAAVTAIQWNLEHISIEKGQFPITKTVTTTKEIPDPDADPEDRHPGSITIEEKKQVIVGYTNRYKFRRLSTQETSGLKDKNTTPLSPPVVSMAVRLADAGADTAEAALALAQAQIQTNRNQGLVGNIITGLFGEGASIGGNGGSNRQVERRRT